MAVGRCEQCGTEEYMPFVCKFCKGRYCSGHRLPENHRCQGLDAFRERARQEGRIMVGEEEVLKPRVRRGAAMSAWMDNALASVEGKMTYVLLGAMIAVYLVQFLVRATAGQAAMEYVFVLHSTFWRNPWTLVTSIFAHASFSHLLFNALALFFFGSQLEKIIGTRRFTGLFFASGLVAGLAQILLFNYLFHDALVRAGLLGFDPGALGASGALFGVMGALVVLAPHMTVLVMFVIPAPLWLLVALYALFDVLGAMDPTDPVAHFAHLGGLAAGLLYGRHLRGKGMRVHMERPAHAFRPR